MERHRKKKKKYVVGGLVNSITFRALKIYSLCGQQQICSIAAGQRRNMISGTTYILAKKNVTIAHEV